MSIRLADAELPMPVRVRVAPSPAQPAFDTIETEEHERLTIARGIVVAMIISTPFWALIGFTFYLLI